MNDECVTDHPHGLAFAPGGIINEGSKPSVPPATTGHARAPRIMSN
jgi:hypothetical protein